MAEDGNPLHVAVVPIKIYNFGTVEDHLKKGYSNQLSIQIRI
jgi:hypothetical protein